MKNIRILSLILLIPILVGCTGVKAPEKVVTAFGATLQAWIDAPLDGMRVPLSPYELVAHASGEAGIKQLEWIINDTSLGLTAADSQGKLVTFRYNWTPPGGGTYTLKVRAQENSGGWSDYDQVSFFVGEPTPTRSITPSVTPTELITLTPTSTLTATSSATPTATATSTLTPTTVAGEIEFTPSISASQFFYGTCAPNSVGVSVNLSFTENVKHVELYLRLLDRESTSSTNWDSYAVMNNLGDGTFKTTVKSRQITGADKFSSAIVLYQFIVIGTNGKVLARSDTFNDLYLSRCGINWIPIDPLLPPIFPINTPIIIK